MFSTPLMASSRGITTLLSVVCALAPVYVALTLTVGGAMSGYCSIGNDTKPITPNITMRIEITVDSTGRLINLSKFMYVRFLFYISV